MVGAGGVGGYLGARLSEAGHEVSYLARGQNLAAIREVGIRLRSPLGDLHTGPQRAADDPSALGASEAVIVTVKLYDLEGVSHRLSRLLGPDAVVLPLQNGIDAHAILVDALGSGSLLKGTVSVKSVLEAPGLVACKSPFCRIRFAEADGLSSPRAERLACTLNSCIGVNAKLSTDIEGDIWRKFVMLASFSAVACLARATIGEILESGEARSLVLDAAAEGARVGRAQGIALPEDIAEMTLGQVKDMPREGRASMLEDLEAGRRIELPWLSGAVVRLGRLCGVATPVHDTAYRALAMYSMGRDGTKQEFCLGSTCAS
jgi:2-dehydropantoate 2-reductase